MTPLEKAQETILSIKSTVLQGDNIRLPGLLREIKTHLAANANIVTLLAPEEIADIIQGVYHQQGIAMEPLVKKKEKSTVAAAKKAASKFTLDDL